MKRFVFLFFVLFFCGFVFAGSTEVSFFYSQTCGHCHNVIDSGILDNVSGIDGVVLNMYDIGENESLEKYLYYWEGFEGRAKGVPFLVIEQTGEFSYLAGDTPIILGLEGNVTNFEAMNFSGEVSRVNLDVWIVVGAAAVDSVNPCAFGVLLFLMTVLLSQGSARRAFRSGLVYTGVIFLVYLAAGFGIMRFAGGFLALDNVKIGVGVLLLIGALIEFKDFFFEGKGFSLSIPKGVKPHLEKYARRGTLGGLVILGALVALVELPCTGGIYLAILSLISDSGAAGIFYLILYNFIFVLPLIIISYVVYRGAEVEAFNDWVQKHKRFMRLAAGLVMVLLALSLIGVF